MNVFQIIAEDEELEEVIPFTKKAKMMKKAGKAAKGATKDEARQLEVELLTYLKTSGQTATADAVLKYFDQKGYGNVAAPIIANLKTKGNKKADRQTAKANKRQAKADAKAAAQADAEKAAGLEKQRLQKVGKKYTKQSCLERATSTVQLISVQKDGESCYIM